MEDLQEKLQQAETKCAQQQWDIFEASYIIQARERELADQAEKSAGLEFANYIYSRTLSKKTKEILKLKDEKEELLQQVEQCKTTIRERNGYGLQTMSGHGIPTDWLNMQENVMEEKSDIVHELEKVKEELNLITWNYNILQGKYEVLQRQLNARDVEIFFLKKRLQTSNICDETNKII